MLEPLDPVERRVLGALAEKEATVPDTYPMTLKGLQTACNQRNSREPVMDLEEGTIQRTLDALKARNLVRFVYASHGARSTKFRHVLHERLELDPGELALVAVLLLRGAQTVNELRTRTERAHPFESNDAVEACLAGLAAREDPLVVRLPQQTGQREARWVHLLGHPDEAPPPPTPGDDATGRDHDGGLATRDANVATVEPGTGLEQRVAELEARVAALEALLTDPDH